MPTGSAQINVRMPSGLRDKGNSTLAVVGSSPTKIVREVWDVLAQGAEAYEQLHKVLVAETSQSVSDEADHRLVKLERATSLFDEFGAGMGLDAATFVPFDDEQTQEALYDEFLESGS